VSPQLANGGRDRDTEIQSLFGGGDGRAAVQSEDCLRLNVWTPGTDNGRRAVLVWLHGGAFLYGMGTGPGPDAPTDGSALAAFADAVVVTVNHRLGICGHFHLADQLGPDYEGSGNAGLLDVSAALGWVRDNAAVFGGDPTRVLVFGQSGGAGKAHSLMAMPGAEALFGSVALQSGLARTFHSRDSAGAVAERLLHDLDARTADDLAATPITRLLEAQKAAIRRDPTNIGLQPFYPVVDGTSMPVHPNEAMNLGWASSVAMVVGTVKDEMDLILAVDDDLEDAQLHELVAKDAGDRAAAVITAYRDAHPGLTPADLRRRIETERLFQLPAIEVAERRAGTGRVWMYEFVHDAPPVGLFRGGAPHAIDVPYVFQTVDRVRLTGGGEARRQLGVQMGAAWVALARSGDPNHTGLPPWPEFGLTERATMMFDIPPHLVNDPGGPQRRAWGQ
jgi:para-nitrobenzyl esterase